MKGENDNTPRRIESFLKKRGERGATLSEVAKELGKTYEQTSKQLVNCNKICEWKEKGSRIRFFYIDWGERCKETEQEG